MSDPFDLERFIAAQDPVYSRVAMELRQGRKQTHWMWFVFPQLAGLGRSAMAERYALRSLADARAYLAHALLGGRLRECTGLVLAAEGKSAHEIFGAPDDRKFHSSMTLFAEAAPEDALFAAALDGFFGGGRDAMTLALLAGATPRG
ncbi:MAG TPA: DUF1810 domain-containing protein [Rhizomicrobium sp.]|nr:DUF1810 domain-containing protein [Rhizomicrobium sp.]